MKHHYRPNYNHDISAAITRIYKQIHTIERECVTQSDHVVKTPTPKHTKPKLKLVK